MDEGAAKGKAAANFADSDERIFALLAIVEDQQTAVRAGIQGLAIERAQLATERVALGEQAEQMKRLTDKLVSAVGSAIPQMAKAAGDASRSAFSAMLTTMGQEAAGIAARATKPELDKFKGAVDAAVAVQLELKKAVKDFRRKWAWVAAFAIVGMVVAASLVAYGAVWWQLRELGQLESQRDRLTAEVNGLQGQAEQARRNNGRKPPK